MGQHVSHLLNDYYDNELSLTSRRQVEAHLEDCPACRAELKQLDQLGDLLSEYSVPDVFSAADLFQAQVVLRAARRTQEHAGYRGAAWHLVPLALLSVLGLLQALLVLVGALVRVIRSAGWLGIDAGLFLAQVESLTVFGLPLSSAIVVLGAVLAIGLYLGLFALWIPYAGWVGALWRSSRAGQAPAR
jgi:anti-sigma factor RsiW